MSKVIIFGILDTAELAHWYLDNDSEHEVVAFTVHKKYIKGDQFRGLPLVEFEKRSILPYMLLNPTLNPNLTLQHL